MFCVRIFSIISVTMCKMLHYCMHPAHTYEYLVEEQPIGRELFHQFCGREPLLSQCTRFLEEMTALELLVDEKYAAAARSVFAQYLAEGVSWGGNRVSTKCVCVSW